MKQEHVPRPKYMGLDLSVPCRELIRLSSMDEPDLRQIAGYLREHPRLAQQILQHVNSIGVGLRNRVLTVEHAAALLGADRILGLARRLLDKQPRPAARPSHG